VQVVAERVHALVHERGDADDVEEREAREPVAARGGEGAGVQRLVPDAAAAEGEEAPEEGAQRVPLDHRTIVQEVLGRDKGEGNGVVKGRAVVHQVGV